MSPQIKTDWNTSNSLWQLSFDLVCCFVCSLKFTASVTGQKFSDSPLFRFCSLTPKIKLILIVTVIGPPPYFCLKICLMSIWLSSLEQHLQQSHSTFLLLGSRQWTMTTVCLRAHARPGIQIHRCANQFSLSSLFREYKMTPLKPSTDSYPTTTGSTVF